MDLTAPLKWAEFTRLRRQVGESLRASGSEPAVTAFADMSKFGDRPVGPAGVAISGDRIVVVKAEGSFIREAGATIAEVGLAQVRCKWFSRAGGARRALRITWGGFKLELFFAPLWSHQVRQIRAITHPDL